MLIRKLPKKEKRTGRFRSQRHLRHVRSHYCINCDASAPIEAAHVRLGSGAGMGQKPDDYIAVALCKTCHDLQHTMGEQSFWEAYYNAKGHGAHYVIEAFIRSSPVRHEIQLHRQERDNAR